MPRCAFPLIALALLASGLQAQPLPPALQTLQSSLRKAEIAHQAAAERLAAESARQAQAVTALNRQTAALISAARQPEALVTTHALIEGRSGAPGLLSASRTLQQQQLADLRSRLTRLIDLQRRASDRLESLRRMETNFADARGRLSKLEQTALTRAALQADQLAATLAAPVTASTQDATRPAALPDLPADTSIHLPVAGRVVGDFRSPGNDRPDGLTFRATSGAAITAATTGTVLYSGPFKTYGGLIIVEGPPDTYVVYANLSDVTVAAGDRIMPGQLIGHLSDDPAPTLYFEVRQRGRAINPHTFLAGA